MPDEARPPYVRFEVRTVEDREATIEQGHYVGRDVVFALVTPAGSRDQVEKEADDWLANIQEGAKQDRIPAHWYDHYKRAFELFKESREVPENGTPISDWPSASPSQIKTLLDINIRTVEDLSEANEETVQRIGMGGRALKEKARAWLDASGKKGKVAEELADLRTQNEQLLERDKERDGQIKELQAQLAALKKENA